MLPQHLEPFGLDENRGLSRALAERVFPHSPATPGDASAADFLLDCVARASAGVLADVVLRLPTVSAKAAKQVAADIGTRPTDRFLRCGG